MPIYTYRCSECDVRTEAVRSVDDRDNPPACPLCVAPTMRRIVGAGIQIVARPWYDRECYQWPTGISQQEKTEKRKGWDKEHDASWAGRSPSKDDFATVNAKDIYKNLTPDTVHRELAAMESSENRRPE